MNYPTSYHKIDAFAVSSFPIDYPEWAGPTHFI
jgi:hypothetical protein